MHLMNSEKSLGLGMGNISTKAIETVNEVKRKEKLSVDYDDTHFLQKMFSNNDNEIKNLEEPIKTPQSKIVKKEETDLLSKKMGAHKSNSVI